MKTLKNIILKAIEIVAIFAIAFAITSCFKIAQVDGHSMDPTLNDGDILIVWALGEPEDNDIVIMNTNNTGLKVPYIVKRYDAEKSTVGTMWVEGDNKENSIDSRRIGTIDKDNYMGTVLFDVNQMKFMK